MVHQLHQSMMARVTDHRAVSEAVAVTNRMKQDCVLALTLFTLIYSVMLMDTYHDERPGIRIADSTDGQLLNHGRMHFQSRVSTTTFRELLFVDDCALNATTCKGAWISSLPPPTTSLRWQDQIPDTDVLQRTGILSICAMPRQLKLRWNGHLLQMHDERLPKRLFNGGVATGSRRQGGPIRRYKGTLKASLKRLQINPANCEDLARDRPTRRRTVTTGATI
nr:unnamed protein product [Spirometra erinaceieuropaei]